MVAGRAAGKALAAVIQEAFFEQLPLLKGIPVVPRHQRDAILDLLADLKMPGSLEAAADILCEIYCGRTHRSKAAGH